MRRCFVGISGPLLGSYFDGRILPRILLSPDATSNYFTQRGLYQIVASCLHCYPTCSTCCSSTGSSNIQFRHPHWAFPRSTHLNGLIVLYKPAISWSLSGAELFATDSQLTCQEIASRSKPISSQAPANNATPTLLP